ncbi:MAG TPA: hypothetical protein VGY66_32870 [Gemmataceae bacterium]|jgi:hypothetical protein|nr:hypothetical protein [Gemmataceae bacterium]
MAKKNPVRKQAKLKARMSSVRKKVAKGLLQKMGPAITRACEELKTKKKCKVSYTVTYAVTGGV